MYHSSSSTIKPIARTMSFEYAKRMMKFTLQKKCFSLYLERKWIYEII